MQEDDIREYIRRFEKRFPKTSVRNDYHYQVLELTDQNLSEKAPWFADRMIPDAQTAPGIFSCAGTLFYGYRIGAISLKGKKQCISRQRGYQNTVVEHLNLDSILNMEHCREEAQESGDDAFPEDDFSACNIAQWLVSPGSNTEISGKIFRKMLRPLAKNLLGQNISEESADCIIYMPPIAPSIEAPDWKEIFNRNQCSGLNVHIRSYGSLLDVQKDTRTYLLLHQEDSEREYVIVCAYENVRGRTESAGVLAFDAANRDHISLMKDVRSEDLHFHADEEKYHYQKKTAETVPDTESASWEPVECSFPVMSGLQSFLSSHDATFGEEFFQYTGNADNIKQSADSSTVKKIHRTLKSGEALRPIDVCSEILHRDNLRSISLGDLAFTTDVMEKSDEYRQTLITSRKKIMLGTENRIDHRIHLSDIEKLPANFAGFTWKLKNRNHKVIPYFSLNVNKHSLTEMAESIVSYYQCCDTLKIAEDLLYLLNRSEEPSAFYVVKVFLLLSGMESLAIDRQNDFISRAENVVQSEKSTIKVPAAEHRTSVSARKMPTEKFKSQSIYKPSSAQIRWTEDTYIDVMNLSVRSYNCLRRAGKNTVGDIVRMSPTELYKVRNLGKRCYKEIIDRLHEMGLELALENGSPAKPVADVHMTETTGEANPQKEPSDGLERPIAAIGLSEKSIKIMHSAGIYTLKDLTHYSRKRFDNIRNLEYRTKEEILTKMHRNGLKLRDEA